MDVQGLPTTRKATMTVTDLATGVPAALFSTGPTTCSINGRVLCQVLSGAILVTLDDPTATPTLNDLQFFTGDLFVVEPAEKARFIRNGTSACVRFQVFE